MEVSPFSPICIRTRLTNVSYTTVGVVLCGAAAFFVQCLCLDGSRARRTSIAFRFHFHVLQHNAPRAAETFGRG